MEFNDIKRLWVRVYKSLPLDEAVALDLYFGHSLSQHQIAEKLDVSQPAVSKIIKRACQKLRDDPELREIWDEAL